MFGSFFRGGKFILVYFFRGRFYPGAVFPGGSSMRGGDSMLQHRDKYRCPTILNISKRFKSGQITLFQNNRQTDELKRIKATGPPR